MDAPVSNLLCLMVWLLYVYTCRHLFLFVSFIFYCTRVITCDRNTKNFNRHLPIYEFNMVNEKEKK